MTIQETIEKAINGGWKLPPVHPFGEIQFIRSDTRPKSSFHLHSDSLFLDPLFWQSLGKAMGWYVKGQGKLGLNRLHPDGRYHTDEWLFKWHRFIDHLAEGKDPESFFKQL